jgi:hypothetical protein
LVGKLRLVQGPPRPQFPKLGPALTAVATARTMMVNENLTIVSYFLRKIVDAVRWLTYLHVGGCFWLVGLKDGGCLNVEEFEAKMKRQM